jgi:prophage regulatory protein
MHRFLRRRDLSAFTGLKPTRISELINEGRFPEPVPISDRAVGWLESEIAEWQRQRIAEREAAKAAKAAKTAKATAARQRKARDAAATAR